MATIDTIDFEVVEGSFKAPLPPPRIVSLLKYMVLDRVNPIVLKIDYTCRLYDDACLKYSTFSKLLLVFANLCNLQFFANKFVCTV